MTVDTILVIADGDAFTRWSAVLTTISPAADLVRVDLRGLRRLAPATAAVVSDGESARIVRATGFAGGIVVASPAPNADVASGFAAQGTYFVDPAAPAAEWAAAFDRAVPRQADGAPVQVSASVARTRRLLAAGEIAMTLQHAFNNPLTALLAEVQLLQMEAPTPDVAATAGRMLELVRRLTELSRSLDSVRDHKTAP